MNSNIYSYKQLKIFLITIATQTALEATMNQMEAGKKSSQSNLRNTMILCGTTFLRVPIYAIFAIFPEIIKIQVPANKN